MGMAGRKRRQEVKRYDDGSIVRAQRGETPEQAIATVKWQRLKMGATENNFTEPLWESPLGKMRLAALDAADDCEGLSSRQFWAIKRYITVRHLHLRAQGFPRTIPKTVSMELVSMGIPSEYSPLDEEEIMQRRRDYAEARKALLDHPHSGVAWCNTVDRIADDDETVGMHSIGAVRCAANVLAHHWSLVDGRKR